MTTVNQLEKSLLSKEKGHKRSTRSIKVKLRLAQVAEKLGAGSGTRTRGRELGNPVSIEFK
jgi:hypothetical protein